MKAFIELNKNEVDTEYHELAQQIWGTPQTDLWVNHIGTGASLHRHFDLALSLDLASFGVDVTPMKVGWTRSMVYVKPVHGTARQIVVFTDFQTELPVMQKGFNNLVAYLAAHVGGRISEDGGVSWLDLSTFKQKHQAMMNAPFMDLLTASVKFGAEEEPVVETHVTPY